MAYYFKARVKSKAMKREDWGKIFVGRRTRKDEKGRVADSQTKPSLCLFSYLLPSTALSFPQDNETSSWT